MAGGKQLTHLPRLMALIALIGMSAAPTGMLAQTPAERPLIDLWRIIRTALTGDAGDKYFKQIKDAETPPGKQMFAGKVVSQPSPTTLVVNVDDPAGDATLNFANALRGIESGTRVSFNGTVESFVREPYKLILRADDFTMAGDPSFPPR